MFILEKRKHNAFRISFAGIQSVHCQLEQFCFLLITVHANVLRNIFILKAGEFIDTHITEKLKNVKLALCV